jgi:hypothetical protein
LSINSWPAGTPTFVRHQVLAQYIQDTAAKSGVHEDTIFNTEVKRVAKVGSYWKVETSTLNSATGQKTAKIWVGFAYVEQENIHQLNGHRLLTMSLLRQDTTMLQESPTYLVWRNGSRHGRREYSTPRVIETQKGLKIRYILL